MDGRPGSSEMAFIITDPFVHKNDGVRAVVGITCLLSSDRLAA